MAVSAVALVLRCLALWVVMWSSQRRPERPPDAQPGGETRRLLESSRGMTKNESEAYEELLNREFRTSVEGCEPSDVRPRGNRCTEPVVRGDRPGSEGVRLRSSSFECKWPGRCGCGRCGERRT